MKASDFDIVPLSVEMHRLQGEVGEVKFWQPFGGVEKAKFLANALAIRSGDTDYANMLILRFRMKP